MSNAATEVPLPLPLGNGRVPSLTMLSHHHCICLLVSIHPAWLWPWPGLHASSAAAQFVCTHFPTAGDRPCPCTCAAHGLHSHTHSHMHTPCQIDLLHRCDRSRHTTTADLSMQGTRTYMDMDGCVCVCMHVCVYVCVHSVSYCSSYSAVLAIYILYSLQYTAVHPMSANQMSMLC